MCTSGEWYFVACSQNVVIAFGKISSETYIYVMVIQSWLAFWLWSAAVSVCW